ncbi:thiamine pyrophosphate-dependent dehydrogenase E1 component subunit alpha [soil metagenome]
MELASAYRQMVTIRRFEEAIVDLVGKGEIPGPTHEYTGQEAVAVGMCAALADSDVITSTHRGHGHLIAKGARVHEMFAELMARSTGLNKGRGGSMHAADFSLGIYGANGMVGAGAPIAVGSALAARMQGRDAVVTTFFGDGALNQGVLLEAMNLAALWKLPVIFACENNGYAVTLRVEDAVAGDVLERARGFGIPAEDVDGMDVEATHEAAVRAVERARTGGGPTFLNFHTYRFVGHNTGERYLGLNYRTDDEISGWQVKDPIERLRTQLDAAAWAEIDAQVETTIAEAIEFASTSPRPAPSSALHYMYADSEDQ